MKLTINGKPRELANGASNEFDVLSLLRALDVNPQFVAVAINGDVIAKDTYNGSRVRDGDVIEIVRMVGGGTR